METVPAGNARFGKYLLLDRIGTGGMSEVFLAKTEGIEGFERKVALKRIFSSLTQHEEFIRSFIHEAKVGGMLYHHNVVQTLDFGRCDGTYFIALEYIEGTHLGAVLHRCRELRAPLPPGLFLQIAVQICEGLDYIHHATVEGTDLNLVHRDIKPSNMLVTTQGLVKISDFGVVKAEAALGGETRVGSVKGTIGYMSPEQARGAEVRPSSDLFSLGAMLYEMATLRRLYGDGDEIVILNRVRDANFQVPIEAAGAYISGLDRVLKRLLSFEPKNRYATAAQAAEALRTLPVVMADRPALVSFARQLGLLEVRPRDSGRYPAVPADPRALQAGDAARNPGGQRPGDRGPGDRGPARSSDPRLPAEPNGGAQASNRNPARDSGPRDRQDPASLDREPISNNRRGTPGSSPSFATVRGARSGSHWQSALVALAVTALGLAGAAGSYYLVDRELGNRTESARALEMPIQPIPRPLDPNAAPVSVDVLSVPATSHVFVDGVLVANLTPVRLTIHSGQRVSVRQEGYRAWEQTVQSDPAQPTQQWVVSLKPL